MAWTAGIVGIIALAVPQPQGDVASPRAIVATVTVAGTEQFCPTVWRLRVDAPADQPVLVSRRPVLQFERLRRDGQWEAANGAPGGPEFASPRVAAAPPWFRWPIAAGRSFELCGEVADWRVLGYPGTYRASVEWAVAGDGALRRVVSLPFDVAPAGEAGAELAASQARDDWFWRAYQRAMVEPLDVARKPGPGNRPIPGPFRGAAEASGPFDASESTPARVVTRNDFQRLIGLCRAVMGSRSGVERDRGLEDALARCRRLESEPGLIGPLARLQRLVLWHACEQPEFAVELEQAREDEDLLAAARWYPDVAHAIGLLSQDGAEPDRIPLPIAVTIDSTEQFCPTVCRFRIDLPVCCDDVLTEVPFVQFLRKAPSGEWLSAFAPPGGLPTTNASQVFASAAMTDGAPHAVLWRFRAGESTAFFGEVADWRVLGYPGTYQAKVRWAAGGSSGYATTEFEVRPAGQGGAALLAAQSAQNDVWRAYVSFMNLGFGPAELPRWRPPGYETPSPAAPQFLNAVQGLTFGSCEPLLQARVLPDGLRERVDLFQLRKPWTDATTKPDGGERTQALLGVRDLYADFGTRTGFAGAFARLQALVLTKACGTASEFEAALARSRQDRDLLDLGLSFPDALRAVGLLVEDEALLPGPGGPRSPAIGTLERR